MCACMHTGMFLQSKGARACLCSSDNECFGVSARIFVCARVFIACLPPQGRVNGGGGTGLNWGSKTFSL